MSCRPSRADGNVEFLLWPPPRRRESPATALDRCVPRSTISRMTIPWWPDRRGERAGVRAVDSSHPIAPATELARRCGRLAKHDIEVRVPT
jgi:hypothetical protein